jgi:hypothetical protein
MISWGDVPDWFAAVGTVGALSVSLYLIWNERSLRINQQARRIAVWTEWKRTESPDSTPRQYYAYVNNASDSPVFVERMIVAKTPEDVPAENVTLGVVAPHHLADYGLSEISFPPDGDPPYAVVEFRDVDRARWKCDSNAMLRRIDTRAR